MTYVPYTAVPLQHHYLLDTLVCCNSYNHGIERLGAMGQGPRAMGQVFVFTLEYNAIDTGNMGSTGEVVEALTKIFM